MKTKQGKRKGPSKTTKARPLAKKRKSVTGADDKYARIGKELAGASPKTLASLFADLMKGKRKVLPAVTLSTFEAGYLAAQLKRSLKPKRRRRKKVEYDELNFSLS